jgi:hypothetical protein
MGGLMILYARKNDGQEMVVKSLFTNLVVGSMNVKQDDDENDIYCIYLYHDDLDDIINDLVPETNLKYFTKLEERG